MDTDSKINMKIIEVNHSIANRFDGYIEINKNLKKYPNLLKPILEHEVSHTDQIWSWKDFKLDFLSNSHISSFSLMKFMFRHPLSFLQFSPIIVSRKKGLVIDINLITMYLIMLLVFMTTIYFGVKYL